MLRKTFVLLLVCFVVSIIGCGSQKDTPESVTLDIESARQTALDANQKIILYGLDGLTWRKIDAYRKLGMLPNLDKVIKNGASGHLESIDPMFSISLWTTVVTGVDFDTHGVQYFYKIGRNGAMLPYTSMDRKVKALWNIMDDMQIPSGWISWWGSWPSEPIEGFNISNYYIADFGFRDVEEMSLYYPHEMSEDLRILKERYTPRWGEQEVDRVLGSTAFIDKENLQDDTWGDFKYGSLNWVYQFEKEAFLYNFLRNVYRNDALAVNAGLQMMNKHDTKLTGIYCNGIDGVSHKFWQYDTVDHAVPSDVNISPEDRMLYGNVMSQYYAYHDRLLGQILDAMDENTTLIIVSDHGFQYVPKSNYISLNPLLYNLGYIEFHDDDDMEKIDLNTSLVQEVTIKPWDQRRFIRINIRSNDFVDLDGNPLGAVRAGKEQAEVRDRLIGDLQKLYLNNKGIPLFTEVRIPTDKEVNENEGQGDIVAFLNRVIFDENFEDEIILPDSSASQSIPLNLVAIRNYHSGNHDRFDSVIIVYGALAQNSKTIRGAKMYDIAPTVLAMMGLPVAKYMLKDGKVLTDAVKPEFWEKYPVTVVDTYGGFTHALLGTEITTDSGDDEVRRMLQGLGYMQ